MEDKGIQELLAITTSSVSDKTKILLAQLSKFTEPSFIKPTMRTMFYYSNNKYTKTARQWRSLQGHYIVQKSALAGTSIVDSDEPLKICAGTRLHSTFRRTRQTTPRITKEETQNVHRNVDLELYAPGEKGQPLSKGCSGAQACSFPVLLAMAGYTP